MTLIVLTGPLKLQTNQLTLIKSCSDAYTMHMQFEVIMGHKKIPRCSNSEKGFKAAIIMMSNYIVFSSF